jgi:hypothetical protein
VEGWNAISQIEGDLDLQIPLKQLCIHHIPMLSNNYLLRCNHLCNHSTHGHNKNKSQQYLVPRLIHNV